LSLTATFGERVRITIFQLAHAPIFRLLVLALALASVVTVTLGHQAACDKFQLALKNTYFKPSNLSESDQTVKSAAMDGFWELVRKVRRKMIANANQHAFEFYKTFTDILMTLVWRPELVK
jgi:hypothetical protein